MGLPTESKQWLLANRPAGSANLDQSDPKATFKLSTAPLDSSLPAGKVLVKLLYLSNDPAQRGWIDANARPERLYVPQPPLNEPMRAYAIGEVLAAGSDAQKSHPAGTIVIAGIGWQQYAILDAAACRPLPASSLEGTGLDITHFLGAFGGTGATAWYGLLDIGRAAKEDVVVVSGAAGATGAMVVQIAKKIVGCKKVIGIAGGEKKCKWVVDTLGADICVDYKASNFEEQLTKATEGFVDLYFDNVGGSILDLLLTRMKTRGRVTACGAISNYNAEDKTGIKNWFEVITQRLEIKGFIVTDAGPKMGEITSNLVKAAKEGKIVVSADLQTVVDTKFEDVPKTWVKLFEGGNVGKLVTKIVD